MLKWAYVQLFDLLDSILHKNREHLEQFSNPTATQCFTLFRSNSRCIITVAREGGKVERRGKKVDSYNLNVRSWKLGQHVPVGTELQ